MKTHFIPILQKQNKTNVFTLTTFRRSLYLCVYVCVYIFLSDGNKTVKYVLRKMCILTCRFNDGLLNIKKRIYYKKFLVSTILEVKRRPTQFARHLLYGPFRKLPSPQSKTKVLSVTCSHVNISTIGGDRTNLESTIIKLKITIFLNNDLHITSSPSNNYQT